MYGRSIAYYANSGILTEAKCELCGHILSRREDLHSLDEVRVLRAEHINSPECRMAQVHTQ